MNAPGGTDPTRRPTVAVVGGGIAGLAAAWELVAGPGNGPVPDVVVLEAGDRLGGKVRSEPFAGRRVDVAADAFLARRPEATGLCEELGLTDQLVPVGASGASIWARHRLRPMPDGLNLGVPTRWWPLVRSGILSPVECSGWPGTCSCPIWAPTRPPGTARWGRSSASASADRWWTDWPTRSSGGSTPGTPTS